MAQLELVHPAPLTLDAKAPPRADHAIIARFVDDGSSVLDVGCGDGALITLLTRECGARARGLERDKALVRGCVSRGLSVVQGDAETDLAAFPTSAFKYVVFSHSFLAMSNPRQMLREAGRVGERVIISISNAAYWRRRFKLALSGRMPAGGASWADDPHTRVCSVRDLAALAREMRFGIEAGAPITQERAGPPFAKTLWRANLFAEEAVFLLAP